VGDSNDDEIENASGLIDGVMATMAPFFF